jgi:hypothetical protein
MGNSKDFKKNIGPLFQKVGYETSPSSGPITSTPPITQQELGIKPLSGGVLDATRVRLIKGYFSTLPAETIIYEDITREVDYTGTLNTRFQVINYNVPENRTLVVDNVYFFATSRFGGGLIPAGLIEGSVQCFFDIGQSVPVEIQSDRVQLGVDPVYRAYFPFLNDRVGSRESNFSFYVKSGRELGAYYINRWFPFIPVNTIGVRFEGWVLASNIFEEIVNQQR